jgi:threonine dehydrogenase-like Zn-dependent dehydrogenase
MTKAKQAVFKGPYDLEVQERDLPEIQEDGLLIKIEAASICGSDGHGIKGTPKTPTAIGHELCGEVVKIGTEANRKIHVFGGELEIGDRIAIYPWITCGYCGGCMRHGDGVCMICDNGFCYGGSETIGKSQIEAGVDVYPHFKGGFAEYLYIFPGTYVWKIPADMPSEIASLLDPLAVGVRAVEMAQTEAGVLNESLNTSTQAVVTGAGPIAALTALVLKMMGCEKVILTGTSDKKLQIAQEISNADELINIKGLSEEERIQKVIDMTNGGADLVIQCANNVAASIEALQMTRKLGTYVEIGVPFGWGESKEIDLPQLVFSKNVKITGLVANHPQAFDKAFHILKRHKELNLDKIFTHKFTTLEDLLPTIKKMNDEDYMKGVLILAK